MSDELYEHRVNVCETRINDHDKRIDKLEVCQAETNVKIESLCKSITGQTKALWWLVGLAASGLIGFFMEAVKSKIF